MHSALSYLNAFPHCFFWKTLPCPSQGRIFLISQVLVLTSSLQMTPSPLSRCCQRSAHITSGLSLIFMNMNSQCCFTSKCQNPCLFAQGWLSDCWSGFDCTLRVESTYWFMSPSVQGCSQNQCLMDEGYKGSSSLDSWQAQLCSWIAIPSQLSHRVPPVLPWGLWLYSTLMCLTSFPGPSSLP